MRIVLAALVLTGLIVPGAAWADNAEADDLYKAKKYDEALKIYDAAAKTSKDSWYPRFRAARCRLKLGQCDQALQDLNEALKIHDNDREEVDTELALIEGLLCTKGWNQALENAAETEPKIVKLAEEERAPRLLILHKMRGAAHKGQKAYPEAIADFAKALEIAPNDPDAPKHMADSYLQMKDFRKAAEILEKLASGKDFQATMRACEAYLGAAALAGADDKDSLERAARLGEQLAGSPEGAGKGWLYVARANIGLKQFALADSALKKAEQADPKNCEVALYRGRSYNAQKKFKEAISALKKCTTLCPDKQEAWQNLGYSYEVDARNREALAAYEKANALSPNDNTAASIERVKIKLEQSKK